MTILLLLNWILGFLFELKKIIGYTNVPFLSMEKYFLKIFWYFAKNKNKLDQWFFYLFILKLMENNPKILENFFNIPLRPFPPPLCAATTIPITMITTTTPLRGRTT